MLSKSLGLYEETLKEDHHRYRIAMPTEPRPPNKPSKKVSRSGRDSPGKTLSLMAYRLRLCSGCILLCEGHVLGFRGRPDTYRIHQIIEHTVSKRADS